MAIIFQLSFTLYRMQGLVIYADDLLLCQNVMFSFPARLHDAVHPLIVHEVFQNSIGKYVIVIRKQMPVLGENCTNSIVKGVCPNFKWLFQV